MQININLSEEQIKALLTEYASIEEYCQRVVENRANRIMEKIVKDYAMEKFELEPLSVDEQKILDDTLKGRFVFSVDKLNKAVKKIIVMKSNTKTMVEKIAEQEAEFKEIEPIK